MKIVNTSILLILLTFGILSGISVKSDFYYDYNRYRITNHLDTIITDSLLEKAACLHSSYLALLNAQTDSFIISHYEKFCSKLYWQYGAKPHATAKRTPTDGNAAADSDTPPAQFILAADLADARPAPGSDWRCPCR